MIDKELSTGGRDTWAYVSAALFAAIVETITDRELNQVQAAQVCRTVQPTLSMFSRAGQTASVSTSFWGGASCWDGRLSFGLAIAAQKNSANLTVALDGRHPAD